MKLAGDGSDALVLVVHKLDQPVHGVGRGGRGEFAGLTVSARMSRWIARLARSPAGWRPRRAWWSFYCPAGHGALPE